LVLELYPGGARKSIIVTTTPEGAGHPSIFEVDLG